MKMPDNDKVTGYLGKVEANSAQVKKSYWPKSLGGHIRNNFM